MDAPEALTAQSSAGMWPLAHLLARLASLLLLALPSTATLLLTTNYSGSAGLHDPCAGNLTSLYDFGSSNLLVADSVSEVCDDCVTGPLTLGSAACPFYFYGAAYSALFINNNGLLSLSDGVAEYVPLQFPLQGPPLLSLFWCDFDSRGDVAPLPGFAALPNRLYYRVTGAGGSSPSSADARRMGHDVAAAFPSEAPFAPCLIAVVTWFAMGAYHSGTDRLNTAQAVVASDADGRSFATYCYDNLVWDYGAASEGYHASIGFNAGDGTRSYNVPGSYSGRDLGLSCEGGAGSPSASPLPSPSGGSGSGGTGFDSGGGATQYPGCFTFRVDGDSIGPNAPVPSLRPRPSPPATASPTLHSGSSLVPVTASSTSPPSPTASGSKSATGEGAGCEINGGPGNGVVTSTQWLLGLNLSVIVATVATSGLATPYASPSFSSIGASSGADRTPLVAAGGDPGSAAASAAMGALFVLPNELGTSEISLCNTSTGSALGSSNSSSGSSGLGNDSATMVALESTLLLACPCGGIITNATLAPFPFALYNTLSDESSGSVGAGKGGSGGGGAQATGSVDPTCLALFGVDGGGDSCAASVYDGAGSGSSADNGTGSDSAAAVSSLSGCIGLHACNLSALRVVLASPLAVQDPADGGADDVISVASYCNLTALAGVPMAVVVTLECEPTPGSVNTSTANSTGGTVSGDRTAAAASGLTRGWLEYGAVVLTAAAGVAAIAVAVAVWRCRAGVERPLKTRRAGAVVGLAAFPPGGAPSGAARAIRSHPTRTPSSPCSRTPSSPCSRKTAVSASAAATGPSYLSDADDLMAAMRASLDEQYGTDNPLRRAPAPGGIHTAASKPQFFRFAGGGGAQQASGGGGGHAPRGARSRQPPEPHTPLSMASSASVTLDCSPLGSPKAHPLHLSSSPLGRISPLGTPSSATHWSPLSALPSSRGSLRLRVAELDPDGGGAGCTGNGSEFNGILASIPTVSPTLLLGSPSLLHQQVSPLVTVRKRSTAAATALQATASTPRLPRYPGASPPRVPALDLPVHPTPREHATSIPKGAVQLGSDGIHTPHTPRVNGTARVVTAVRRADSSHRRRGSGRSRDSSTGCGDRAERGSDSFDGGSLAPASESHRAPSSVPLRHTGGGYSLTGRQAPFPSQRDQPTEVSRASAAPTGRHRERSFGQGATGSSGKVHGRTSPLRPSVPDGADCAIDVHASAADIDGYDSSEDAAIAAAAPQSCSPAPPLFSTAASATRHCNTIMILAGAGAAAPCHAPSSTTARLMPLPLPCNPRNGDGASPDSAGGANSGEYFSELDEISAPACIAGPPFGDEIMLVVRANTARPQRRGEQCRASNPMPLGEAPGRHPFLPNEAPARPAQYIRHPFLPDEAPAQSPRLMRKTPMEVPHAPVTSPRVTSCAAEHTRHETRALLHPVERLLPHTTPPAFFDDAHPACAAAALLATQEAQHSTVFSAQLARNGRGVGERRGRDGRGRRTLDVASGRHTAALAAAVTSPAAQDTMHDVLRRRVSDASSLAPTVSPPQQPRPLQYTVGDRPFPDAAAVAAACPGPAATPCARTRSAGYRTPGAPVVEIDHAAPANASLAPAAATDSVVRGSRRVRAVKQNIRNPSTRALTNPTNPPSSCPSGRPIPATSPAAAPACRTPRPRAPILVDKSLPQSRTSVARRIARDFGDCSETGGSSGEEWGTRDSSGNAWVDRDAGVARGDHNKSPLVDGVGSAATASGAMLHIMQGNGVQAAGAAVRHVRPGTEPALGVRAKAVAPHASVDTAGLRDQQALVDAAGMRGVAVEVPTTLAPIAPSCAEGGLLSECSNSQQDLSQHAQELSQHAQAASTSGRPLAYPARDFAAAVSAGSVDIALAHELTPTATGPGALATSAASICPTAAAPQAASTQVPAPAEGACTSCEHDPLDGGITAATPQPGKPCHQLPAQQQPLLSTHKVTCFSESGPGEKATRFAVAASQGPPLSPATDAAPPIPPIPTAQPPSVSVPRHPHQLQRSRSGSIFSPRTSRLPSRAEPVLPYIPGLLSGSNTSLNDRHIPPSVFASGSLKEVPTQWAEVERRGDMTRAQWEGVMRLNFPHVAWEER